MSGAMSEPVDIDRLEAVLGSLRATDREIFLAHRLDGLSFAEIAQATGFPVAEVERRIARALYEIDRYLAGERRSWWRRR